MLASHMTEHQHRNTSLPRIHNGQQLPFGELVQVAYPAAQMALVSDNTIVQVLAVVLFCVVFMTLLEDIGFKIWSL